MAFWTFIRIQESFIRENLQNMQFTKGTYIIVHIDGGCWLL